MTGIRSVSLGLLVSASCALTQVHAQAESGLPPHCQVSPSGGELTGRVVRERDTAGVAVAVVQLIGTGCQVTTGPDGSFRFAGLAEGTYLLLVRAIGFSLSDSITIAVTRSRVATVMVPLSSTGPIRIDPAVVLECADRAYSEGAPPAPDDSLLVMALCIALGPTPLGPTSGLCVEWGDPHAALLGRFQWHPARPVRSSECAWDDERWTLHHPMGNEGVRVSARIPQQTDSTATIELGIVSHPLAGYGMRCPVMRTYAGWMPYRWCYRTWVS
jgi:hypothetical protein